MKAYEAILAHRRRATRRPIDFLRQMYEKRRDWEKLIGLMRREAERAARGPGARARSSSRSRSSPPSASRSPRSASSSGTRSSPTTRERRGAQRARRSLRARARTSTKLADVLAEAGRDHLRRARRRSQLLTKLGTIYGDRLNDDERAVERVAHAPHARPERSQGAGGAQEEVPHARPLGRSRGLLRRERQVGRVHPRPRAARGEGDRRRSARSACS